MLLLPTKVLKQQLQIERSFSQGVVPVKTDIQQQQATNERNIFPCGFFLAGQIEIFCTRLKIELVLTVLYLITFNNFKIPD